MQQEVCLMTTPTQRRWDMRERDPGLYIIFRTWNPGQEVLANLQKKLPGLIAARENIPQGQIQLEFVPYLACPENNKINIRVLGVAFDDKQVLELLV